MAIFFAALFLLELGGCSSGDTASAQGGTSPLRLDPIRPEERSHLLQEIGVSSLEELPRIALDVEVDDTLSLVRVREEMRIRNSEDRPWNEVVLRLFANAMTNPPPLRLLSGRCLETSCRVEAQSPSVIVFRPSAPLRPRTSLRIAIELEGQVPEIAEERLSLMAQGLESLALIEGGSSQRAGDYGLFARGGGILSLASFYAVPARRRQGRWETDDGGTMGDLSTDALHHVEARFSIPSQATLVATGIEEAPSSISASRKEVRVVATAIREFAALISPSFSSESCTTQGVRVRSFFLPAHREAGTSIAQAACRSLALFSQRFGPYPYTELDVVEAPLVGGAGGVEFSGLVTVATMFYRDGLDLPFGGVGALLGSMLGGSQGNSSGFASMIASMREFVTAHEVAHQWWHGLVGSDSRRHPWIDEALAQYSAILYVEEFYGPARAREEAERQVAMSYRLMRLQGHPDAPVDRPISAFRNPIAYAGIVYGKAPFFYRAIRETIGDQAFFRALLRYASSHRFREASPRAVVDAFVAEAPSQAQAIRRLARRWLEESHGDEDLGPSDPLLLIRNMMPPEMGAIFDDPMFSSLFNQFVQQFLSPSPRSSPSLPLPSLDPSLLNGEAMEALGRLLGGQASSHSNNQNNRRPSPTSPSQPSQPSPKRIPWTSHPR
ncbi:MAG: M1 family metallopeptidase [Sandaracinaceae bacterium]|nr:M1 family metallopeptidase [Sandaracinaceae bacterium]